MRWVWPAGKTIYTGIDLGRTGLKAVQLSKRRGVWTLASAICVDYAESGMLDSIAGIAGKLSARTKRAALSLPIEHTDVHHLLVPELSENDRGGMIHFEMAKRLDYPLEDACIDYTLSNGALPADDSNRRAIAFAYRRRDIKKILAAFSKQQIDIPVFDVAPMALINAMAFLLPGWKQKTVFGLDIGSHNALAAITKHGSPLFVRNLPIQPVSHVKINSMEDYISYEIERTLSYCRAHMADITIDAVALTGGALVPGLASALEDRLKVSVSLLNIFNEPSRIGRHKNLQSIDHAMGTRFTIAIGTAMRMAQENV